MEFCDVLVSAELFCAVVDEVLSLRDVSELEGKLLEDELLVVEYAGGAESDDVNWLEALSDARLLSTRDAKLFRLDN